MVSSAAVVFINSVDLFKVNYWQQHNALGKRLFIRKKLAGKSCKCKAILEEHSLKDVKKFEAVVKVHLSAG